MAVNSGGLVVFILAFITYKLLFPDEDKKVSKTKNYIDIDPFRDDTLPYTSIEEEYQYNLYYIKSAIYSKIVCEYKNLQDEINHYTTAEFTKYGNHYKNIYNRYRKINPKDKVEMNILINNFSKEYEKTMNNLVKRLIKKNKNIKF